MGRRARCKACKQVVEHTSTKGLCIKCSCRKMAKIARQLHEKKGIYYERWKEGLLKVLNKK